MDHSIETKVLYHSPQVTVVTVAVEEGFAESYKKGSEFGDDF